MQMALDKAGKGAAQLVAAESIVEAETKDHQNWELLGLLVEHIDDKDWKQAIDRHRSDLFLECLSPGCPADSSSVDVLQPELLQREERRPGIDEVTDRDVKSGNATRRRRQDGLEHLHRLEGD